MRNCCGLQRITFAFVSLEMHPTDFIVMHEALTSDVRARTVEQRFLVLAIGLEDTREEESASDAQSGFRADGKLRRVWRSPEVPLLDSIHHDCKSGKRSASRDASLNLAGSSSIFSPRKWLQRKLPHSEISSHNNKSEVRLQKCDGLKLELLLLTRSRCAHQYEFVEGTSQMISEVLGPQMLRDAILLFIHACRKGQVNENVILK
ncbi:Rho GTPase-activating protein 6 [Triplophysa tibetana]|uniref:Rho GTPase-activating protein 6 n=1 Tax=Triplophysa tibetana TaxID=1572043 RepID=A0A5A9P2T5_9TELE|nr:Rho GTPase-activating protein 6 [Triplophysa tibetana]